MVYLGKYYGWSIFDNGPNAPVTGRYSCMRWGVRMCANNLDLLNSMIRTRATEDIFLKWDKYQEQLPETD